MTDEQENVENKKDEKYKKNEKNGDKTGYYVKQPIFGTGKPSWLKQQFGKTVAIVVGALTCILFYFLLLRAGHISGVIRKIFLVSKPIVYGLAIAYLLNPIVKAVDRKLLPFLEKKFPNFKQAKSVSRSVGICISIVILATIIFTLFNMMIPELYKSIRDMIMNVPSQMNRFIRELSEMNTENSTIGNIVESVMKEATTFVQNWMRTDLLGRINDFMSGLTVGVLNFMREIMNILIGLIVSVYVLFSKEKFSKQSKNNKVNPHLRLCKQNKNRAWDCPYIRSEKRNYICHTDDHTDKHRIWHIQNRQACETKNTDNSRINDFSYNKSSEYFITLNSKMKNHIGI